MYYISNVIEFSSNQFFNRRNSNHNWKDNFCRYNIVFKQCLFQELSTTNLDATGESTFNTSLPKSIKTPTLDAELTTKIYVDTADGVQKTYIDDADLSFKNYISRFFKKNVY
jgi:hypothetical protein